jgi:hypothetical protein
MKQYGMTAHNVRESELSGAGLRYMKIIQWDVSYVRWAVGGR